MFAVIASKLDKAGMNIKHRLLELYEFKQTGEKFEEEPVFAFENIKLYTTEKDSINCENYDEQLNADLIIFATKHCSAAGRHSLSLHMPGNWTKAELGGQPGQLCIAPPLHMKNLFAKLNELGQNSGFEITMEVTHHGPLLKKTPCLFIEIGSTEPQWGDEKAGKILAKAIIEGLAMPLPKAKCCIGLGGGHYAPYFNRIMLKEGYAIGHICPKYATEELQVEMLKQAIERTQPRAQAVLLDWKGLGVRKQEFVAYLGQLGTEILRCRKLTRS